MKIISIIACVLLLAAACKVEPEKKHEQLKIVCSTSIIRDCIQEIVGDSIAVESLMGPGVDPHSYNPLPSDISALNDASVVIYNGLHLEGKMVELFEELGKRKPVFSVSASIPKDELILTDKRAGTTDPHIWFDTRSWLKGLEGVVDELGKKYPEHKKGFLQNFSTFREKVATQRIQLKKELATVPRKQRVLITSHDAFHYFGRSLDIEVKALQGISTTQEPGVQDVINLVNFIVNRKINSLFIEHSVSPKAIQTVIESCEKKGHHVRIGGTLYSDALGDKTGAGGTYIGMLQYNVNTIINGLK